MAILIKSVKSKIIWIKVFRIQFLHMPSNLRKDRSNIIHFFACFKMRQSFQMYLTIRLIGSFGTELSVIRVHSISEINVIQSLNE